MGGRIMSKYERVIVNAEHAEEPRGILNFDHVHDLEYYIKGNWFIKMAVESPDVKHEYIYEDRGNRRKRYYKGFYQWHSKTKQLEMWGSLPIHCLTHYNHHIGENILLFHHL